MPLGQALVETALALPVFLMLAFIGVDVGRFFYLRGVAEGAVRWSERALTVDASLKTDCIAITSLQSNGAALNLSMDPASQWNDPPTPSATPPANQGYAYIHPAAQPPPICPGSAPGGHVRPSGNVTTYITYLFVPSTPVFSQVLGSVTLVVADTEPTQY